MSEWKRSGGTVLSRLTFGSEPGAQAAMSGLLSVTALNGVISQSQSGRRDISATEQVELSGR